MLPKLKFIVVPSVLKFGLILAISLVFAFSIKTLWADWTAPLSSPPTCIAGNPGCDAPINVSATPQTKGGAVAPSSLFHLYNTTDNILTFQRSGALNPTGFRLGTDSAFIINNDGFDTLKLDAGNVGIRKGVSVPAYPLDVAGTVNMTGFRMPNGAAAGRVLTSDISGVGTWQPAAGGLPAGTSGQTLRYDSTNTLVANSLLFNNGTNIGIGTTAPGSKLEVAAGGGAGIFVSGAGGNGLRVTPSADTNNGILNVTNAAFTTNWLAVNAGGQIIMNGTGNVGIGTTSPGAKLEVAGQVKITGGNPGAGKVLTSDVSGLASWQTAAGGGLPAGSSGQTLRHDGTNWVVNSTLFNNGTNVGIGTTAPAYRLDVNDQMRATRYNDNVAGYYADLDVGGNLGGPWQIRGNLGTAGYSPGDVPFGWGGGLTTWDVVARGSIFSGNNSGVSNGGLFVAKSDTSGANRAYHIGLDGNYYLSIGDYANGAGPYTPIMTMRYDNQYVGIGTTAPAYRLDVNDQMRATRYNDNVAGWYVDSDVTSRMNSIDANSLYDSGSRVCTGANGECNLDGYVASVTAPAGVSAQPSCAAAAGYRSTGGGYLVAAGGSGPLISRPFGGTSTTQWDCYDPDTGTITCYVMCYRII